MSRLCRNNTNVSFSQFLSAILVGYSLSGFDGHDGCDGSAGHDNHDYHDGHANDDSDDSDYGHNSVMIVS